MAEGKSTRWAGRSSSCSFYLCTDKLSKVVKSMPSLGFTFSSGKEDKRWFWGLGNTRKAKFLLALNYKKAIFYLKTILYFFDMGSTMSWLLIFKKYLFIRLCRCLAEAHKRFSCGM